MPRNRMISPEFWSDEEIGKWSHSCRLFYIGLWNFADDEGRFKAHNDLLKAQIFPYDKSINLEKLKGELNSKIQWYENNGLQYGYIRNFLKHQRIDKPTSSKLPIPPPLNDNSPNNQGTLPPKISKVKISKDKYMDFVLLTSEEYAKLVSKLSENTTKELIDRLNNYIGSTGKRYKSHYYTLLNWSKRDAPQARPKMPAL